MGTSSPYLSVGHLGTSGELIVLISSDIYNKPLPQTAPLLLVKHNCEFAFCFWRIIKYTAHEKVTFTLSLYLKLHLILRFSLLSMSSCQSKSPVLFTCKSMEIKDYVKRKLSKSTASLYKSLFSLYLIVWNFGGQPIKQRKIQLFYSKTVTHFWFSKGCFTKLFLRVTNENNLHCCAA